MKTDITPFLIFLCTTFFATLCHTQVVTVSQNISIRNNLAYNILGQIEDRILFYQEKGNERHVLLYDEELVFQSERQINLDKKRCSVYEVINRDTAFAVVYGYRDDGQDIIKLDLFSKTANRLDSIVVSSNDRDWNGLDYEPILSQDESKLLLYDINGDDKFKFIIVDLDRKETIKEQEYKFGDINLFNELNQILLANDGTLYMLLETDNVKSKRKDHKARIFEFTPAKETIDEIIIPLDDILCQDLFMTFNNQNDRIGIAGLYDEKKSSESSGYFWIMGDRRDFGEQQINLIPFDEEIFFEVYGNRNNDRLEDFYVADVIWKSDAAPILVMEMAYDVNRRGGQLSYVDPSYYNRASGIGSGWSDHYRDDLVLISLNDKGDKDWHQVFYKKQFSQNDNAAFSSFFPFITPSRLRLIYNDEIKSNSTVSEYILDAQGNYKRTSVLSTEYQDLKLRFADAHQISSTELLVPSQKSYTVNIVKIDFSK